MIICVLFVFVYSRRHLIQYDWIINKIQCNRFREATKKIYTKLLLSTCLLATLEVQRENLFLYSVLFVVLIVVIISNPFREINVSGHSKSYKHSQCKHNTILCASNIPIQWKAIQICMACEWCLLNTVSAIIMEQKLIHMLRNFFFCVLHVHTNSLQCTQKFIAQHKHVASRIITPISQTVVLPGIRFCMYISPPPGVRRLCAGVPKLLPSFFGGISSVCLCDGCVPVYDGIYSQRRAVLLCHSIFFVFIYL